MFEEGELEAIAAGVDLQEWKRLMRNAGESSRLNYYHQAPNTDWCHPLESTCPSVSEDVPTLVQSPEPNGVCGNIHSAMSNKRDVDPVVRSTFCNLELAFCRLSLGSVLSDRRLALQRATLASQEVPFFEQL